MRRIFFNHLILLFSSLSLLGCAGYIVKNESSPFEEYKISSISVPMFLNRTVIGGLSGPITSEVKRVLHLDTKHRIYAGRNRNSDAVLIGILDSSKNRRNVLKPTGTVFTDGDLEKSIGNRNKFYIPNSNTYKVSLNLILIKRPTKEELKLLHSKVSGILNLSPKIVFQKKLELTGSYSRVVKSTLNSDSGGIVNFTTNREVYRRSVSALAVSAANQFREEILYAF